MGKNYGFPFWEGFVFGYNLNYSRWEFQVLAQKKKKNLYNMVIARHIVACKREFVND